MELSCNNFGGLVRSRERTFQSPGNLHTKQRAPRIGRTLSCVCVMKPRIWSRTSPSFCSVCVTSSARDPGWASKRKYPKSKIDSDPLLLLPGLAKITHKTAYCINIYKMHVVHRPVGIIHTNRFPTIPIFFENDGKNQPMLARRQLLRKNPKISKFTETLLRTFTKLLKDLQRLNL